ncbi:hypothetical protein [Streptomyces piniterrae]|uniref:hypothetical protein n=1 Tax=Streptomyces piniterrae TaxID=2571125 RepID=UPI0010AB9075|nr:hypothetical protein [Streptomyces piniterrae]
MNQPAPEMLTYGLDIPTLSRVPEVPRHLRHIAAALCEPLLAGGYLPASYREVMSRIGEPSLKKVRMLVGELCTHYTDASPELKDRLLLRLVREQEQLGIPADPQLRRGLWTFGQDRARTTEERGAEEGNRRRALALPDYYEVAQILVSHFRITAADVERLPRGGVQG